MRIFVGLDIDDEIRERMARFIAEMRALAPDVRWVAPESLHVTLKFIGEKPDAVVKLVQEQLSSISATGVDFSFRDCGFFPTAKSARVFWVGIEAGAGLVKLASEVEEALAEIGIPKEDRAFSPHLTLARAGSGAPGRRKADKSNKLFAKLQQKLTEIPAPEFGTMSAREVFLYRSQLSSQVAIYQDCALRSALSGRASMKAILISAGIGYLLGSIPFGYLLVRIFRGADVRATGSGNIGATNVARTSRPLGIATLFLDALKGLAAVLLVSAVFPGQKTAAFVAAFAAVCGHIFPVWLGFRGGKGVATGLGSLLLLTPKAILVAIGIFLAITAAFRFVSLGSIVAAASLPLFALLLGEAHRPAEIALIAAASLLIIVKHHQNIRRLLTGTEPKFHIRPK